MAVNTVIATNIMALNSNRYLGNAKRKQSTHSSHLSSGSKINSASDDAASVTISEKMKAQIRGLNRAEKNTEDAISLLEVAEGALHEISEIVQRCRELSIQAATDTNTTEDKRKIATEMLDILYEIDEIYEKTEFNGTKIFTNDFVKKFQVGGNSGQGFEININYSTVDELMTTIDEELYLKVSKLFTETVKASIENVLAQDPYKIGNTCTIYTIPTALCDYKSFLDPIFTSIDDLNTAGLDIITQLKDDMKDDLNTVIQETRNKAVAEFNDRLKNPTGTSNLWISNVNGAGSIFDKDGGIQTTLTPPTEDSIRVNNALVLAAIQDPNKIVAIDSDLKADDPTSFPNRLSKVLKTYEEKFLNPDLYQYNMRKELEMFVSGELEDISATRFGTNYITAFDNAVSKVSDQMANIGVTINRLNHIGTSLEISSENLYSANSQIADADMAYEMMELASTNVVVNAAMTLLAQSNSSKGSVMQLLE